MNCYGSGLFTILVYSLAQQAANNAKALITESGNNVLTEASQNILIET